MTDEQPKAATGIDGLDYVLHGGLPANHVYLVEGDPGTGKTTLGLQFLLAGRKAGERCLYLTLSESAAELNAVARSHGWSLNGIDLFEMSAVEDRLRAEEQYTVFHPSEVELNETMERICGHIVQRNPARVVFDSLSEMRLMARDALRYRRQVLALKQFFFGRQCTVLLLDDHTSGGSDRQLESVAHGVLRLDSMPVEYGGARRQIYIPKLRGLNFRDGRHDLKITSGGIVVYPRLVAATSRTGGGGSRAIVSSGVPELDNLMGGGPMRGTSTLVLGPAGSGKSTIATQYALAAAQRGERAAIYVFEETRENYLERAKGMDMDLTPHLETGNIDIRQIDPCEVVPGQLSEMLRASVESGTSVVVVDSLNAYMNSMPSDNFLLLQMHELLTYLNGRGVVSILVVAQHNLMGASMTSSIDVTYLADSVILLRYFEAAGEVKQAIAVVKKRIGRHERTIREMKLTSHGIHVGQPLTQFHGVLTGVPTFQGAGDTLLGGRERDAQR